MLIKHGAHHLDLMFETEGEPPEAGQARAAEKELVKKWIGWKGGLGGKHHNQSADKGDKGEGEGVVFQ